ncbi:MAG: hypothetical protein PHS48_08260, partial [Bacteroidales bacterium]|nr:hypothetical protein [Bacteroidales bacterium]
LQVLKGRRVVAFPDVDGFSEWKEKLSQVRGLDIVVSDVLEKNATVEDREKHVDIADLLIRQHRKERINVEVAEGPRGFVEPGDAMSHPTFLKLKKWLGAGNLVEVALLVAGLDLEVVGWRRG